MCKQITASAVMITMFFAFISVFAGPARALDITVPGDYSTYAEALAYLNDKPGSHTITQTADVFEDIDIHSGAWNTLTIEGNDRALDDGITIWTDSVVIQNIYLGSGGLDCRGYFELYGVSDYNIHGFNGVTVRTGCDCSIIQNCSFFEGLNIINSMDITISDCSWGEACIEGIGEASFTSCYFNANWNYGEVTIVDGASAEISNCVFTGNSSSTVGINATTTAGNLIIDGNSFNDYPNPIIYDVTAVTDNGEITNNSIEPGNGLGLTVENGTPKIENNTITGCTSEGIRINGSANPDLGGGDRGSIGGNVIHDNDSSRLNMNINSNVRGSIDRIAVHYNGSEGSDIDVYNNSTNDIYARDNDWGTVTNGLMAGNYYNTTDIDPAVYDCWEDTNLGYLMWSFPGTIIELTSHGRIKAIFGQLPDTSDSEETTPPNVDIR
ncbi:MAG: right-handed parallel beta-helix repeat-containing protein [Candidatus Aegiribacteria sp.]|nr:right-handed parallel beta-helix repeat-containing protein [Candidatus Aegiribacteria sp.]